MYTWTPYPFLRITFAFIIGILSNRFVLNNSDQNYLLILLIGLFMIYIMLKYILKKNNLVSGNLGLMTIILCGNITASYHDQSKNRDHLINHNDKISGYYAVINSSLIEKEKYFIYDVAIIKALAFDSSKNLSGIIKLYHRRQPNDTAILKYGDEIFIKGNPFRLPPPGNPNEFNYMKYMAGQNIYFQQFVDTNQFKIIKNNPSNQIMAWANHWRLYFSKKIDNYIFNKQEAAIANALILGVKDGLDNKIKSSYSSAGAMHVLAVSGLHAGIIYLILQSLFRPFIKKKFWKVILPIFSIISLWSFALITGLSPSIMRAVTMFSIIIIGEHFFSRPNVFNSLALSAFILLIYNPNFLFSVGFQLSYIAVAGIVYLYPLVYNLIKINNNILNQIWSITSVSISAQIATFPLTLYYFHQFPTYFLISNLLVIPAAFVVMSFGIALLASPFFFISDLIGFILETLIGLLNWFVFYIQELNMSLIEWLFINEIQTISIYALIFSFLLLIHYRKMVFIKLMFISAMTISISGGYNLYTQSNSKKLIFYDIKDQSLIDQIDGFKTNLSSVNEVKNIELVKHQIDPYRLAHNLNPVEEKNLSPITESNNFDGIKGMIWNNKKILFISKSLKGKITKNPIHCDILVISQNAIKKISELNSLFTFKEIILDNSNNYYSSKNILKECEDLKINCTSVEQTGAVILSN